MTLDIRGSLKSTKLSRNPYVVFEELISNAIDSFLIRKSEDVAAENLQIDIEVEFYLTDLIEGRDSGCGFGDEQLGAFLTKDTSYKDDLPIAGIGKCMGAGRIQYFHHFSVFSLDSTYRADNTFIRRQMSYSEPKKQIEPQDFTSSPGSAEKIGTTATLKNLRMPVRERILRKTMPSTLYSASVLKQQMLLTFLQRLVGLGDQVGDFEINFVTRQETEGDLGKFKSICCLSTDAE